MSDKTKTDPRRLNELINHDAEYTWLKEHDLMPGSDCVLRVDHKPECPCQQDWYGLDSCTCDIVEYEVVRQFPQVAKA